MTAPSLIYQVSDLVNEMRRLLETSYPEVWIEGELSSLSTPASGHLYFNLKDEQSQLRCAMFRNRAGISRYRPKAGDLVRVRARISVYSARGDLQCIVQHIEEAGEGALQRRFEELKMKLQGAGLFAQSHKKPLPKFARHIGLITSATGAAIRDVLSTLARRAPGIPVTIYPTVVQGDSAPDSIVQAIADAVQHQQCDVLILSRGGGSLEDLWCFNDEKVAQAIFDCPITMVSGVGHEVDVTISDLVADYRAPTPTAAAEILSPDNAQLIAQINSLAFRLPRVAMRLIQQHSQSVDHQFQRLIHPKEKLQRNQEAVARNAKRLNGAINQIIQQQRRLHQQLGGRLQQRRVDKQVDSLEKATKELSQRMRRAQQQHFSQFKLQQSSLAEQLNLVSPLATLGRGFSIARDSKGVILRDINQLKLDDAIKLELKKGHLSCQVNEIKRDAD